MRGDRAHSTSPVWQVDVSPRVASIRIRSQWKLAILLFAQFACVGVGLHWAVRWYDLPQDVVRLGIVGAWFCWFMAAASLGGGYLFERSRSRKAWLICRPLERAICCPRLDKVFPIDQVYAMQLITGQVIESDCEGRTRTTLTQLNLIVRENGRLQRYPLIGDYGPGRLSKHAELLSGLCDIRLLKDKASSVADWS